MLGATLLDAYGLTGREAQCLTKALPDFRVLPCQCSAAHSDHMPPVRVCRVRWLLVSGRLPGRC
jgi:hypothetical protein